MQYYQGALGTRRRQQPTKQGAAARRGDADLLEGEAIIRRRPLLAHPRGMKAQVYTQRDRGENRQEDQTKRDHQAQVGPLGIRR